MIDATYNVIFSGKIRSGFNPVQVRAQFQKRFNIQPEKMDHFFSGKPIVIMKNMTFAKAEKLVAAIQAVGADAEMEAITPSINLALDLPPEPPPAEPAELAEAQPVSENPVEDMQAAIKRQREAEEAEIRATQRKHKLGCAGVFLGVTLIALVFSLTKWYIEKGKSHPEGILVQDEPRQTETEEKPFYFAGYEIVPLADFSLEARVLSRKHYDDDATADISPTDLALGWGPMSNSALIRNIDISQSTRFYFYRVDNPVIPLDHIGKSSSNMHMVPPDKRTRRLLKKVRKGDLIRLSGYLIEVKGSNGFKWRSSLKRNDTGNGACEIIWLKSFEIL